MSDTDLERLIYPRTVRDIANRAIEPATAKICTKGRGLQNLTGSHPNACISQIPDRPSTQIHFKMVGWPDLVPDRRSHPDG